MPFEGLIGRLSYGGHYWFSFWLLTLSWRYRRGGASLFPPDGPALIIANHQSFIDPLLVSQAVGRPLTYLARKSLFTGGLFDRLISHYGAVPIDRGFGKEGIEQVLKLLKQNRRVLIFPEGQRTATGELQEIKPGISLLIRRARVPIVPVGIAGAFESWPRGQKLPSLAPLMMPRFGSTISVQIGKPIPPETCEGKSRDEIMELVALEMKKVYQQAYRLRGHS